MLSKFGMRGFLLSLTGALVLALNMSGARASTFNAGTGEWTDGGNYSAVDSAGTLGQGTWSLDLFINTTTGAVVSGSVILNPPVAVAPPPAFNGVQLSPFATSGGICNNDSPPGGTGYCDPSQPTPFPTFASQVAQAPGTTFELKMCLTTNNCSANNTYIVLDIKAVGGLSSFVGFTGGTVIGGEQLANGCAGHTYNAGGNNDGIIVGGTPDSPDESCALSIASLTNAAPGDTPLPAAAWLFGSVLAGSAGVGTWRRKRKALKAAA